MPPARAFAVDNPYQKGIIDDFLRGGGTARGVYDLMREYKAEVVGIGVLIDTTHPREKLVEQYVSILTFDGVDESHSTIRIAPSRWAVGRGVAGTAQH